jgi:hypothetical protein
VSLLTIAEIEAEWILQGGNPQAAPMAAAIAMAETGGTGNTEARNPGGTGLGLYQINPQAHSGVTTDLAGNTKQAIQISKNGTDWSAWQTFTNGAYQHYLPAANAAFPHVQSNLKAYESKIHHPDATTQGLGIPILDNAAGAWQNVYNQVNSAVNSGVSIAKFLGMLTDPKHLLRIAMVIGGIVLIIVVLVVMVKTSTVKNIVGG